MPPQEKEMDVNKLTTGPTSKGPTQMHKQERESQVKCASQDTILCFVVRRKTAVQRWTASSEK